jgi:hypothetical protein
MKTYPISNTNFSGLYINDSLCSQKQKDVIDNIKTILTDSQIADIKNRGYDIFLERTPKSDTCVSVSVINNFDFTNECAVKTCRKIHVGDYYDDFDLNNIYKKVDSFEKDEKKAQNFAKIMIGILLATATALWAAMAVKITKPIASMNSEKAATEVLGKTLK